LNVVVDTHPLVWHLAGERRRLGRRARRIFDDADGGRRMVHVPAIVLMELVLLEQIGRIRVRWTELREQIQLRPSYRIEPLTAADVDEARSLGALPDPFDRMIAATAVRLGMPVVTRDEAMVASPRMKTVW
jgi:PIN domain nuclease of toxin-antitoxin system